MRQVFKGDNYSREETIRGNTVCLLTFFLLFQIIMILLIKPFFQKSQTCQKRPNLLFGWFPIVRQTIIGLNMHKNCKNICLLTFTENVGLSIAPQAIKDLQIWPPLTSFTWLLKTAIVLNTLQVNTFEKGHCYQRICTEILHSNTQSPYWDFESRVFLICQLIF